MRREHRLGLVRWICIIQVVLGLAGATTALVCIVTFETQIIPSIRDAAAALENTGKAVEDTAERAESVRDSASQWFHLLTDWTMTLDKLPELVRPRSVDLMLKAIKATDKGLDDLKEPIQRFGSAGQQIHQGGGAVRSSIGVGRCAGVVATLICLLLMLNAVVKLCSLPPRRRGQNDRCRPELRT